MVGASVGVSGFVMGVYREPEKRQERYLGRAAGPSEERTVAFENARREACVRDDAVDVRLPDGFVGATDLDLE